VNWSTIFTSALIAVVLVAGGATFMPGASKRPWVKRWERSALLAWIPGPALTLIAVAADRRDVNSWAADDHNSLGTEIVTILCVFVILTSFALFGILTVRDRRRGRP
jgi:hypothetical protein